MDEIKGTVAKSSDTGIKLAEHEGWFNYTKPEWRKQPWHSFSEGDTVALAVQGDFVKAIKKLGGNSSSPASGQREMLIARESAIKSAIELLHDDQEFHNATVQGKQQMLRSTGAYIHGLIVNGLEETEPEPEPEEVPFE